MTLTQVERDRFRKQELLPFVGPEGMEQIKDTTVLMVGLGGGGCAACHQLAVSNIGRLVLCDFDVVGTSNLGRQFLHSEATLGIHKVVSAKIALKQINPYLEIETISKPISREILEEVRSKYDNLVVFVAVDKFYAHYLINDFCIENQVPAIHIAQLGFKGFIYTYDPNKTKTCIECAIKQNFNKKIDSLAFDRGEQDLPYFAPIISIMCSTGVVEIVKMRLKIAHKSMANIFCIYRGVEHEDIFETKQSKKSFFDEVVLNFRSECPRCRKIKTEEYESGEF